MKLRTSLMVRIALFLSGVAFFGDCLTVNAAVPPTVPDSAEFVKTDSEQGYVEMMQGVVDASKAKGSLDVNAMNQVFDSAVQANVRAEVVGEMVAVVGAAYPESVTTIASSALTPYRGTPHRLVLYHVMHSAVMSNPRPFSVVLPVHDSLMRAVDHSKDDQYAGYIKYIAARIGSSTPDNPLNQVNMGEEQKGLAIKRFRQGAAGYNVLFLEPEIGLNPFFANPQPVSDPGGATNR